jgi:hypothetical protein
MGRKGWGVVVVLLALAGSSAYSEAGKQGETNSDHLQLKEHVAGTITRIDGKRIRVLEDVDQNGCATSGVKLIDIVENTKLRRSGALITNKELQRGDRVVIEATARGQILEANEIWVQDSSSTERDH